MLTPPGDLPENTLAEALAAGWGMRVAALNYLPVGWGSHHWDAVDSRGSRWFITVDELENKRVSADESLDDGFARLRASLRSAAALRKAGCEFVIAPVIANDAESLLRFGARFAVAVYPFTEGRTFRWDEWTAEGRTGTLSMVAAVHLAPERVRAVALREEFWVPFRDQLEAACGGREPAECGPYTRATFRLLREHGAAVRRQLTQYDRLAGAARARPERYVLTHGEPHPGNTMLTADGWRLLDWDTVLVAPPERDLWALDTGDGSVPAAYAAATGVAPLPELIEFYRMGWDVKDMAYDAARFFRPHADSADDRETWDGLTSLVRRADELMEPLAPWRTSSLGMECPGSGGCSPTGRRRRNR
jgi:spectinomycin phosphotransferase/16S rRNA (guanine(1405)-N(7))-methyltransferase